MFDNLVRPSVPPQTKAHLTRRAVIRLAVTLGLTLFDWYGFQLTRQPDVAPYLNHLERALLPVLFAGMLSTLLHLWVLTFRTFRAATRTCNFNDTP